MGNIIGIGTDITECARIASMIERHGELFTDRVYTDLENEYCSSRKAAVLHYAGRWCAKEAILKAIGTGWVRGITWRDMEIRNDEAGRPTVAIRGGVKEVVERLGIAKLHISISHSDHYATATAIAEGRD